MTVTLAHNDATSRTRASTSVAATLSHVVGDQTAVTRFLQDPRSHNLPPHGPNASVTRIDTHGAAVFLAGDKAYGSVQVASDPAGSVA